MHLKDIQIEGFKSFANNITLTFPSRITGVVGPNGSGKSNITEAFRFVLGEQSMKNMRSKRGEDLIFNGGKFATKSSKATIIITFNNNDHILHDTFDEVSLTRIVNRDGMNEYYINDTQVRQRDIVELLARANVGSTGHHIISQGDADRILNASQEERKEIIEDGLGLKLFQYRKTESEKKLKKTKENLKEVDIVLRELSPQLKYLTKQVEKYEMAKEIRETLIELYAEYLANEIKYISVESTKLDFKETKLEEKINLLDKKINLEKENSQLKELGDTFTKKTNELREKINELRGEKDSLTRKIGQIEGEIHALESISTNQVTNIDNAEIEGLINDFEIKYKNTIDHKTLCFTIIQKLKGLLNQEEDHLSEGTRKRILTLKKQMDQTNREIFILNDSEKSIQEKQKELQKEQENAIQQAKSSEKSILKLITEKNIEEQELSNTKYQKNILEEDKNELKRELEEGVVLVGNDINKYKTFGEVTIGIRQEQKDRRRILERKKIKLESMTTDGGEDTYREYEDLSQRVEFLTKEKIDIEGSIESCEKGIETLQKEIDARFKIGIVKISTEFEKFFKILFGGGHASIQIEKKKIQYGEEEEYEIREGVGISLSLPHKKINTLEQLSGGERALVSIALLFAISQITPPPFLILDETDAALDEANSRRYGDMIEELAKKSQLIVVTHNRETMHRASTLYGVTMNNKGISALLSIAFEEAVEVAK